MNIQKNRLVVIFAFVFAVFSTASVFAQQKLEVWLVERVTVGLLRDAAKKAGVELDIKLKTHNEVFDGLIKAQASGSGFPDLVNIDIPFYSYLSSKNILAPLDSMIAKSTAIKMSNYYQGPKESVLYNGKTYGIPFTTNTLVLFYNKTLFKKAGLDPNKPPKTWDELYAYAKKLNDPANSVSGLMFSFPDSVNGTFQILPWIQMAGHDWNSLNNPAVADVFKYLKRFFDEKLASSDSFTNGQDPRPFVGQLAAMQVVGPWALDFLKDVPFEWGIALLPVNTKYNIRASALGGTNFSIPVKSANQQASFKVLEEVAKEQGRLWNELGVITPNATVVVNDPRYPDVYEIFREQMKYARPRGPHVDWPKISGIISSMTQRILTGRDTPEKALERADKALKRL